MMNRRGRSQIGEEVGGTIRFIIILGIILGIIGIWNALSGNSLLELTERIGFSTLRQALDPGNMVGFEEIFKSDSFKPLNYIIGKVPQYLISSTSEGSAAIIMIGIWLLFFLTFSDIATLFSTFNRYISWVIGFVLAVIATNLKAIAWLALVALAFTAGFGVLSVTVGLIGMFVVFILFNFGVKAVRDWIVARKEAELEMRAKIGAARGKAGLRVMKEIGDEAVET